MFYHVRLGLCGTVLTRITHEITAALRNQKDLERAYLMEEDDLERTDEGSLVDVNHAKD